MKNGRAWPPGRARTRAAGRARAPSAGAGRRGAPRRAGCSHDYVHTEKWPERATRSTGGPGNWDNGARTRRVSGGAGRGGPAAWAARFDGAEARVWPPPRALGRPRPRSLQLFLPAVRVARLGEKRAVVPPAARLHTSRAPCNGL